MIDNEIYSKVKDYSKNKRELEGYYKIGELLVEAQGGDSRAKYGDRIIKEYSKKTCARMWKKYNERTLRRIRQFYTTFKNQKWSTLSTKINWSHFTEPLPIKDINKINYYIKTIEQQNLGVRKLRKKIKNNEYERLPEETKRKIMSNEEILEYT